MLPTKLGSGRDHVFVSYSHRDRQWLPRLLTLLKPYVMRGQLQVWADDDIQVGDRWERKIDDAMDRARVGVLLISQNFFGSEFIAKQELPTLLKAAAAGQLRLFCFPLSAVDPNLIGDLEGYQWAREPRKPIDRLSGGKRNQALVRSSASWRRCFPNRRPRSCR